ncbi:NAD(P)-binding domain,Short-chain dehydrogenase/reductase SDR [Cinara cedri]|uniref:15-hydroxyprostaglandin dehydrogenase [NAD(+)] n=1 Tax=Cinara cedri TaxID=506608 RepID=A0A5E4N476_9HEMI|nr:NAD(P)-binding domain,Short-chain dehydrogenase/reductase SDR [Cinara cedri]
MGIENRVALVTGAASEIGQSYVKYLLLNRAKVVLCDVHVDKCRTIAEDFGKELQHISALSIKCDVTDEIEFENAFKTCLHYFGHLDIVVNNAGAFDNSTEKWSTTVNINYGGIVRGTLLAIKYMGIANGGNGGTVIQTTSSMVSSGGIHYIPMYKSTKKCVIEFTKTFGGTRNFGLHGVRIITLCPELTDVNCTREINEREMTNENLIENLDKLHRQLILQKSNHVGNALIEILDLGKTGETWIVEENKSPRLLVNY